MPGTTSRKRLPVVRFSLATTKSLHFGWSFTARRFDCINAVYSFMLVFIYMNKSLSGRSRELKKTKEKSSWIIPRVVAIAYESFSLQRLSHSSNVVSQITKVVVTRARSLTRVVARRASTVWWLTEQGSLNYSPAIFSRCLHAVHEQLLKNLK